MAPIIKNNSAAPTKKSQTLSISSVGLIQIFEGDNPQIQDNSFLGMLEIPGMPSQVHVTFEVDANRFLSASVSDQNTGNSSHIVVNTGLSKAELECMVEQAEKYNGILKID